MRIDGHDIPDAEYLRAVKRFEAFHHRKPRAGELIVLPGLERPVVALEVGPFVGIAYQSASDGEDYMHYFDAKNQPTVYVDADGDQIFIIGGRYVFKSDGFNN